jgi:glycosyltransferase involved in cell wall biosynthesis
MTVLYVLATYGGMLHYLAQLANAMSRYADVVVIGPRRFPRHYFHSKIRTINVFDSSMGGCAHRIRKAVSLINLNLVKRIEPDVIHITDSQSLIALFVFLTRLRNSYPMVHTNHDPQPHMAGKFDEVTGNFLHNSLIGYDRIIVHGKILKDILVRKGVSEKKIRVIPHGCYSFFQDLGSNNAVLPEPYSILFFGHIRKYKGLEYLIKAIPLVSKELPQVKLIIAGEGDFSRYFPLITDRSRFEIHNRSIADDMVTQLFQRSQLLVLPYVEATQSGPLHIAYALKKPVVATSVGAIPEAVENGKTGLLVPPRNTKALAEAIVTLLKDDKLRMEMSENAYRKATSELSWDNIAKQTMEVYKEALEEREKNRAARKNWSP